MIVTLDLTLTDMNDINDCLSKIIKQYKNSDRTSEDELKMNQLITLRKRLFFFITDTNRIRYTLSSM